MIIADIVLPYVTSALSRYERIAYGILSQSIARIRRSECIKRYYIERFLSEHAQRIRGSVLEGKDAGYTRRFGRGMRPHVVNIDRDNRDADLHTDLNVPGSVPIGSFDCVILTPVMQFLFPETAWPTSGRRPPPVGS